jgi:hypothetical protein
VYYWSICDKWRLFNLQSLVLFVVDDSFLVLLVYEWSICVWQQLWHLGVPMVCLLGLLLSFQNLKTKTNLIREVCFGVASYTKGPFTIETS